MPMFCVTNDDMQDWLNKFNDSNCPDDLTVIEEPKLFLSCRLSGMEGKAYACYGEYLAELITCINDIYDIAAENCA